MSEKELLEELKDELSEQEKEALLERARYEKEFDETQAYIQLIMRTIFAVIIDLAAFGLCILLHVKNLFLYALLAAATVMIGFYIYAIIQKRKERKKGSQ